MFNRGFDNVNIAEIQKKYSKKETLVYPSVVKLERDGYSCWLALWINDGIPQHCQCSSEKEAWYIIDRHMRGSLIEVNKGEKR